MYYSSKLESLRDLFGTDEIRLESNCLIVAGHIYPIVNDVIILLEPHQYPHSLKAKLRVDVNEQETYSQDFAEDIQFTFGEEWQSFPEILPEHKDEFALYFDLIDLPELKNARVCDLGCGIGRWSYFLKDKCRELVLVDFSEAIFVARQNLKDINNAFFFMGDLKQLPFKDNFSDLLFCIGVLHTLPTNALDEIRALKKYAPLLLIYLYYNLDNRPVYFHVILLLVTMLRKVVSKIRSPAFRSAFSWFVTITIYLPLVWFGKLLKPFGLSRYVPLYEPYSHQSIKRIPQDVYDRFFTGIEQRFSRKQIMELEDTFSCIKISDIIPYWHFICRE